MVGTAPIASVASEISSCPDVSVGVLDFLCFFSFSSLRHPATEAVTTSANTKTRFHIETPSLNEFNKGIGTTKEC
jgi:hypothetical protein